MKLWIFIPVIVLFFFQSRAAMAQRESFLLTDREFMALTFGEQKHYIKKVREIIVEMNETNPRLVAELAKRSKLFAVLMGAGVPIVNAGDKKNPLPDIPLKLKELIKTGNNPAQDKIKAMIEMLTDNSRYYSTDIDYEINNPGSKTDLKLFVAHLDQALTSAKLAAFLNKMKITDPALKNQIQTAKIDPIIEYVETAQKKMKKKFPTWDTKKSEQEISDIKQGSLGRVDLPDLVNNNRIIDYHKRDDIKEKLKAENTLYRCMYAGFVIKSDSCDGLQKIPWNLTEINLDKYVCENDSRMCNPLIFGVDVSNCDWKSTKSTDESESEKKIKECLLESKPFCTPRSTKATKNCANLSNTDAALETAVHLITSSKQNRNAMKEFAEELTGLCHDKNIKYESINSGAAEKSRTNKDIEVTCDNARKQFDKLKKKFGDMNDKSKDGAPKPAAPASASGAK